ncbi:hypothetical protein BASA61_002462 [Batrachochytrium salamandrivorans]|nr:hypothetical protein BASA61_002462 [Batrachochytrium salamandrivorans]KAH9269074.1 hypothetical protein BASA83_008950 [Batrachochytrium salamandrivorans]
MGPDCIDPIPTSCCLAVKVGSVSSYIHTDTDSTLLLHGQLHPTATPLAARPTPPPEALVANHPLFVVDPLWQQPHHHEQPFQLYPSDMYHDLQLSSQQSISLPPLLQPHMKSLVRISIPTRSTNGQQHYPHLYDSHNHHNRSLSHNDSETSSIFSSSSNSCNGASTPPIATSIDNNSRDNILGMLSSLLDTDISPGLDFSNIEFPVPPPLSSSTSTLFSLSAPPSISTTGTDMFLMENSPASAGSSWTWPSSAKCSNNDYSDTAVSGYAQMGHNDLLSVLDTPMELTPMGINPTPLDTTLEMALALAATSSSYEVYDGQLHAQHRMEPSPYAFLPLHHMSVGMVEAVDPIDPAHPSFIPNHNYSHNMFNNNNNHNGGGGILSHTIANAATIATTIADGGNNNNKNNMNTYMSDGINACTAENNHQTNYSSEIIHPALAFGAAIPMAHVKPLDPIMSLSSAKLLDLPSTPSMDVPAVEPSSYRHLASSKLHLSSPSTPPLPALLTHQLFRSVSATGHVPEDYESPSSHATSPTEPPVVLPSSWSDDDGMLVCKVSDCRRKFDSSHSLRSHARCHLPLAQHMCSSCDHGFRRLTDLHRHIRTMHVPEHQRPWKCSHCSRRFGRSDALRRHLAARSRAQSCPTVSRKKNVKTTTDTSDLPVFPVRTLS